MSPDHVWHDLSPEYGVLELHERLTSPAPALELHLLGSGQDGGPFAWWEAEDGSWLGAALVGSA